MKLQEIMSRNVESVSVGDNLVAAANKMKRLDIGFLAVVDETIVGVVTDRDLIVRAVAEGLSPSETKVDDVMSRDVEILDEDQDIQAAAKLMQEKQIRRVLVTDSGGAFVGVVSLSDLATEGHETGLCGEAMEQVCKS